MATDAEILDRNPELLLAAAEGVSDVLSVMAESANFDLRLVGQGNALSEIEEHFRNPQGQVEVEGWLDLMSHGFASPENPVFILVSRDLVAEGTNFIFGVTLKELGLSLQSTARFEQGIADQQTLRQTIRHIARHEFGHLVGLDTSTITRQDTRGGLYTGHCVNECTMSRLCLFRPQSSLRSG